MPKFLLLLKIFNTVAIGGLFIAVAFLAFAFYLGNRETHQLLKEQLAESFLIRFGAFALLGFAFSIFPIFINILGAWLTPWPLSNAYRFAGKVGLASVIGSLGGTALFFSH